MAGDWVKPDLGDLASLGGGCIISSVAGEGSRIGDSSFSFWIIGALLSDPDLLPFCAPVICSAGIGGGVVFDPSPQMGPFDHIDASSNSGVKG